MNRTLDQMCTVTRPGVAAIAAASAVELFASVTQHPLGREAPASSNPDSDNFVLGIIPHQIRGFLSSFSNVLISGRSYDCCSACSRPVYDAYMSQKWNFVINACNKRHYVEEISGLAEVQRRAEQAAADIEKWEEEASTDDDDNIV